jgi:hypothetical protein
MGGDAVTFAARRLGERVAVVVWIDAFRSLGNEPVSPREVVDAFVAPLRDDVAAAVDQFARNLFSSDANRALVDRIAADMAASSREAALGSLRYALIASRLCWKLRHHRTGRGDQPRHRTHRRRLAAAPRGRTDRARGASVTS